MEKSDPQKQITDAEVKDDKGRIRGHLAIGPSGQLVVLPPGTIGVAATVEAGIHVTGLKDGWRLGTQADVKRKQDEEKKLDADRAKAAAAK
jgi:hypothetical protein